LILCLTAQKAYVRLVAPSPQAMKSYLTSTTTAKALTERCEVALHGQFGRTGQTQILMGRDWSNPSPEAHEQRQS
jgi:hypothetical protein